MITKVSSLTFSGIEITDVDVQIQITSGVPVFIIVGLADKTIAESKERVKAALSSIGLALPAKRILVNLSPADLVKEGSHFDLAIALGILASMGLLPTDEIAEYLIFGELSLDGEILPVSGALPAAMGAVSRDKGIICAKKNGHEAAWSGNNKILAAQNLIEILNHFKGTVILPVPEPKIDEKPNHYLDLKDIKGQKAAKRALEITAAGGHNLIMFGAPGTGKSMLAQRLPGLLPPLSAKEILEISTIASISGNMKDGILTKTRPFRAPHHSCSIPAMVGGGVGRKVRPGEISLAHNGVLFLDELPEFNSSVLESLRQPIETGDVLISRSGAHIKYPARFQLVAAMNPCKCGYLNDEYKSCSKAPRCGSTYMSRISGPMLDRFDLHIEVGGEEIDDYNIPHDPTKEEASSIVAARILDARERQIQRYEGYDIASNAFLDGQMLIDYAMPIDEGVEILNAAAKKFRLSMRSYNRILRVARTIADLAGVQRVCKVHIAEALRYRQLDFSALDRG